MGNLATHVGQKIRLFRKIQGLTVEQLAARIQKSKATVYKYESGQIPLDVDTLADISSALGIDSVHFLNQPLPQKKTAPKISFFDRHELYTYYYDGRTKRLTRSLLRFQPDSEGDTWHALFFMNLPDFDHPELSRYMYSGTLASYETVSYFFLRNTTLPIETLVIEMLHPFRTSLCTWGLFLGLSDQPLTPMATKLLISKVPLSQEELEQYPLIFTKEELRDIREKNALLLSIMQ